MTNHYERWLILIMSLSGQAGTPRMRIWRALRGLGAAVVRDGVYLLPAGASRLAALQQQAEAIDALGGKSMLVEVDQAAMIARESPVTLFDRDADYADLREAIARWHQQLSCVTSREAQRRLLQLRQRFQTIADIDFFPGAARDQAAAALAKAEKAYNRWFVPDEPHAARTTIQSRDRTAFQGRLWATRRRLWVDRVASAWLIQRFIDRDAHFRWLESPGQCPEDALGFDFDGATFTHVDDKVTFEVLLDSFGLAADPALVRLGELAHYLDVGGLPVPEAVGIQQVLAGAREQYQDDSAFLQHVGVMLDDLYRFYTDNP